MILRRVIEHVRDQNWTAVFAGDLLRDHGRSDSAFTYLSPNALPAALGAEITTDPDEVSVDFSKAHCGTRSSRTFSPVEVPQNLPRTLLSHAKLSLHHSDELLFVGVTSLRRFERIG